jgi:hypothetical protein
MFGRQLLNVWRGARSGWRTVADTSDHAQVD